MKGPGPSAHDLLHFRHAAVGMARAVGAIQRRRSGNASVVAKGEADITTDVDVACERCIVEFVQEHFPDHEVLGEEGTAPKGQSPFVWIVDPLDGTKNYTHGYARSAVSIALAFDGEPIAGAVYNPAADEMFSAVRAGGATLGERPIHVSSVDTAERAMVASALTYAGRGADRVQLERLARLLAAVQAVRSDGCAALDLCDVACGRFDAYFEPGLKPWDTAAGTLIVREAGGRVTTLDGSEHKPGAPEMLASNGRVHETIRRVLHT